MAEGVPEGVPTEAADAARDTLGGAVAEAEALPAEVADALLDTAREAFTVGMQVAALCSAVVAAATAVVAVVFLRGLRPAAAEEQAEPVAAVQAAVD